jgi:hypothetical protein
MEQGVNELLVKWMNLLWIFNVDVT